MNLKANENCWINEIARVVECDENFTIKMWMHKHPIDPAAGSSTIHSVNFHPT